MSNAADGESLFLPLQPLPLLLLTHPTQHFFLEYLAPCNWKKEKKWRWRNWTWRNWKSS